MHIRKAQEHDLDVWSHMRTALWPDTTDAHIAELKDYFCGTSHDIRVAYLIEADGERVGFLELNVRNFAEGSRHSAVPYVEAWYVKPAHQGKGYGKALMQQAENWARESGFSELASDTTPDNTRSIHMHKHLGFKETERVVCFLKDL
ncbi:MAG: histone acetyltransferase [Oleiphilus sp.]|nr:MAG: histone acetyltransferase [Oleiphilus sp.]